jgi:hypothetical protein
MILVSLLFLLTALGTACDDSSTTPTPTNQAPQPKAPIITMSDANDIAMANFLSNYTAHEREGIQRFLLPPIAEYHESAYLYGGYGYWEVKLTFKIDEPLVSIYKVHAGTGECTYMGREK